MITESTTYECDGVGCGERHVISKTHHTYGNSPIADWIILQSGICYCSVRCFLSQYGLDSAEVVDRV